MQLNVRCCPMRHAMAATQWQVPCGMQWRGAPTLALKSLTSYRGLNPGPARGSTAILPLSYTDSTTTMLFSLAYVSCLLCVAVNCPVACLDKLLAFVITCITHTATNLLRWVTQQICCRRCNSKKLVKTCYLVLNLTQLSMLLPSIAVRYLFSFDEDIHIYSTYIQYIQYMQFL